MSDSPMRILVTGGAGFIGMNLARYIAHDGAEVIVFDNTSLRADSVDDLSHISTFNGDVRDFGTVKRAAQSVDGIVHLAAVSRVIWGYEDPRTCVDVNVSGTTNILEAARHADPKPWVIFGSSREVYGEPENLPVPESAPKNVVNVYGVTKLAGEKLCERYHNEYGLNVGILRFSNVYGGPNDHLDRVIPKFILQCLNGDSVMIQGGGQLFDFTHVSDTVLGIRKMIETLSSLDGRGYCDDFHILTGRPTSLQELVSTIEKSTKRCSEIIYEPARTYDVEKFYGDPTKAEEQLGFSARVRIEDGIRKYVPLLEEHLKASGNCHDLSFSGGGAP